jgi:hypothetical protein
MLNQEVCGMLLQKYFKKFLCLGIILCLIQESKTYAEPIGSASVLQRWFASAIEANPISAEKLRYSNVNELESFEELLHAAHEMTLRISTSYSKLFPNKISFNFIVYDEASARVYDLLISEETESQLFSVIFKKPTVKTYDPRRPLVIHALISKIIDDFLEAYQDLSEIEFRVSGSSSFPKVVHTDNHEFKIQFSTAELLGGVNAKDYLNAFVAVLRKHLHFPIGRNSILEIPTPDRQESYEIKDNFSEVTLFFPTQD